MLLLPLCKGVHYFVNVLRGEFVVVRHLDALGRSINEQHLIVRFTLFQHHDAGGNTGTKEQVARQLDDAVNEVIVHQILANFLLCAATVHDAREADNCRRTVGSQPCQRVHDKSQIRFALRSQHTSRGKARVIDEQRILVTGPLDGVRRIRYDEFKGSSSQCCGLVRVSSQAMSNLSNSMSCRNILMRHRLYVVMLISCPKKPLRTASRPSTFSAFSSSEPEPQAGHRPC